MLPKTKLSPPIPHREIIPREHLSRWLQDTLPTVRLVLLCAPAGYGKTTLLATLPTAAPDYRLAWITLDADDNEPVRFLTGLGEALQAIDPRLKQAIDDQVSASTGIVSGGAAVIPLRQAMVALINAVLETQAPPFILALDDLHSVTSPAILDALGYLIDNLPAQMRLAVAARHEPAIHLSRLRARRQVAELSLAELRFGREESAQFLNELLHLGLDEADLGHIQKVTEGWPAGLVLLTSSLRSLPPPRGRAAFLRALNPVDTATFHYLADEVMAQQPPDLRDFLVRCSLLSELTPSACQYVTGHGDAADLLDEAYRRNLFLTLVAKPAGSSEKTYHFHALFTEYLQNELNRLPEETVVELHRRAAQAESDPGKAISHLLAARDWQAAAERIELVGEQTLENGMHETVMAWIEALPQPVARERYRLMYLLGMTGLLNGDLDLAGKSLEQALDRLGPTQSDPIRGQALIGLASLARIRAKFSRCAELVGQAERYVAGMHERINFLMLRSSLALDIDQDWGQAKEDLQAALRLVQSSEDRRDWFMLSLYLGAEFTVLPGMLDELEQFCQEGRRMYQSEVCPLRLGIEDTWASIHLRRGRLMEAIKVGKSALRVKDLLGGYPFLGVNASLAIASAYMGLGNYPAAEEYQELASIQTQQADLHLALTGGNLYPLGYLRWLEGRTEDTRQIYAQMAGLENHLPLLAVQQKMLGGLLEISAKRYAAAEASLLEAVRLQAKEWISEIYGSARLLLGYCYYRWDKPREALAQIEVALASCEKNHTSGTILQAMPVAAPLLRLAVKGGTNTRLAKDLLDSMGLSVDDQGGKNTLLTERQLDILRLMAAGYSNQAIADDLVLTLATVKSHAVHIMNRLGASSRMEAVAKARKLGYL